MLQSELKLLINQAANNYIKILERFGGEPIDRKTEAYIKNVFVNSMMDAVRGNRKERVLALLQELAGLVDDSGIGQLNGGIVNAAK